MVAAQVFQPESRLRNCDFCHLQLLGALAPHLCSSCGAPQAVKSDESFFTALSAPLKFEQDLVVVQRRFYELSRALHPDRFARAEPAWKQASLERMSFLNEAFEFLKDRGLLREHFFSSFGVSCGGGGGMWMMELSERWFEVQETESPEAISEFEAELLHKQDFLSAKVTGLEERFDRLDPSDPQARQVLEEIQAHSLSQNTLKSMIRDVLRLKARMRIG